MSTVGILASNHEEAQNYVEAIANRGVGAMVLQPNSLDRIPEALENSDALIFTGGTQIVPDNYGEKATNSAGFAAEEYRDKWEIAIMKAALAINMPVLGICRGMQLLNVVSGGKLIQDIPGHFDKDDQGQWKSAFHQIYISPGSKLAAILGSGGFVKVNSQHHQGLMESQKASSLLASAYSLSDGIIEALESPAHDWVVGVQWHNELFTEQYRTFGNLFQALAERADQFAEKRMVGL